MYLREMGTVELLSREGEIAIAKRIEAGRDMMIGGLCESPLTFRAIIAWHEALKNGKILLRDVIDLEAMQAGQPSRCRGRGEVRGRAELRRCEDDEEGEGGGLSLSALEEKLKPEICDLRRDRGALQEAAQDADKRLETLTTGEEMNPRSEKSYDKLREELVAKVRAGAAA